MPQGFIGGGRPTTATAPVASRPVSVIRTRQGKIVRGGGRKQWSSLNVRRGTKAMVVFSSVLWAIRSDGLHFAAGPKFSKSVLLGKFRVYFEVVQFVVNYLRFFIY